MSKKKQGGKTTQHVRPEGKRLGVKVSEGQKVSSWFTLVRQRGTRFHAGQNVKVGRDHTLYSMVSGAVNFSQKLGKRVLSVVAK